MTIVIIYPVGYCSHGKTGQARSTTYKTPVSERICTHTRFYRRPRQTSGNTHFLPSPPLSLSLQIRVYRCSPNTYTGRTVRWRARVSTRTRQAAAHSSADLRYCGGRSPRISVLVIRSYEWAHREESSSVAHVNQVYVYFVSSLHFRARRCNEYPRGRLKSCAGDGVYTRAIVLFRRSTHTWTELADAYVYA